MQTVCRPLLQKRLNELGYRQRLGRPLKWQTVFCFTFSIMSPLTAITGLYFQGLLYGGPVALIWGWVLTSILTVAVGLAFSELCSTMPQSGGEALTELAGCTRTKAQTAESVLRCRSVLLVRTMAAQLLVLLGDCSSNAAPLLAGATCWG